MSWRLALGRLLRRIAAAIDAHRRSVPRRELIDEDLPEPGWHRVSFGPSSGSDPTRSRLFDGLGQEERPADGAKGFGGLGLRRD